MIERIVLPVSITLLATLAPVNAAQTETKPEVAEKAQGSETQQGVLANAANPTAPSRLRQPSRLAGWKAWQEKLAARGITPSASLTGLWIGDVAGGIRTGGLYNSLGFAGAEIDLEKLAGWKGGHAFANAAWIRGRSASREFVGDALVASNLDGFDSIRLYQAWLEQALGTRVSLRAGVLGADDEFAGTDGGAMFTNRAFGWEAGIGGNIPNRGPIYFAPALGARLELKPLPGWTVRLAGYDGDSFDSPAGDPLVNEHGLHFRISNPQGAFLIGEAAREWDGGADRLPGNTRFGAWRHTADFPDNLRDADGGWFTVSGLAPAVHHGNDGVYGVFEQKLWNERADAEQGIDGWLRLANAAADRSRFEWVTEAGVRWTGLLPGRNVDAFAIGIATAYVSRSLEEQVREANALDGGSRAVPDYERVVETGYRIAYGDHWSVTPGAQWVIHPGTTWETPNAVVAQLRISRQ